MGTETRERSGKRYNVRTTLAEETALEGIASACSLSVPALMRRAALGHQVTSTVDFQAITELSRLRGDLGRVGGLLKLWLSEDGKWPAPGVQQTDVRGLVDQLQALQSELRARIEAL